MSHNSDETLICPNCGSETKGNYCYQCGQATHLHNETMWGLILHLFEHYFHYDSKFWQTMKTLCLNPGKLTVAYWNKQRARYLSPVSLYVFISAVYFIFLFMLAPDQAKFISETRNNKMYNSGKQSMNDALNRPDAKRINENSYAAKYMKVVSDPALIATLTGRVMQNVPKIFFFMIPAMALLTNMVFYKRKGLSFVDHNIFSLHVHSFHFFISLIAAFFAFVPGNFYLVAKELALVGALVYLGIALKNAFDINLGKALLYTFIVALCYFIVFNVVIIFNMSVLIYFL